MPTQTIASQILNNHKLPEFDTNKVVVINSTTVGLPEEDFAYSMEIYPDGSIIVENSNIYTPSVEIPFHRIPHIAAAIRPFAGIRPTNSVFPEVKHLIDAAFLSYYDSHKEFYS